MYNACTGDLNIVDNNSLRKLMGYGCKYRPPCNLSPDDILISLNNYLESFITAKNRKYALHKYEFSKWKDRVMEEIKNRTHYIFI